MGWEGWKAAENLAGFVTLAAAFLFNCMGT